MALFVVRLRRPIEILLIVAAMVAGISVGEASARPAATARSDVAAVAAAINAVRDHDGLPVLRFGSGSCQTKSARRVAKQRALSHSSCENILAQVNTFDELGPAWAASAPHHEIIDDARSARRALVGVARDGEGRIYVAVDFGL